MEISSFPTWQELVINYHIRKYSLSPAILRNENARNPKRTKHLAILRY